jgi:hypothetical protein
MEEDKMHQQIAKSLFLHLSILASYDSLRARVKAKSVPFCCIDGTQNMPTNCGEIMDAQIDHSASVRFNVDFPTSSLINTPVVEVRTLRPNSNDKTSL